MFFCKSNSREGNSQRNIGFAHFGDDISTHNDKICTVSTPAAVGYVQKESVELFAYSIGGSGKPKQK